MLPLLFIPNANALTAELMQTHQLDRLIQNAESRFTSSGPGGVTGLLVGENGIPNELLKYDHALQRWSPRFGMSSMIGTFVDSPPTPAEIARESLIDGDELQLLDGSSWTIPKLRSWQPGDNLHYACKLPQVLQQCPTTGAWLLDAVIPRYRDLWNDSLSIAESLFAQLRSVDSAELEWDRVFDFAVKVLAVNYRVDASLISHLQALHVALSVRVVNIALDWDTLRAHLKNQLSRSALSGTNSHSGAMQPTEDSTTPTVQP